MKCSACNESMDKESLIGANIFDALTGMHIITRWYCRVCSIEKGLIKQ